MILKGFAPRLADTIGVMNSSTPSASARRRGSAVGRISSLRRGCHAAGSSRRAPILIVDDDPAVRRTLAQVLAMYGFAVQTAGDGVEALAQVADHEPALVLLDMRMPLLDGWGFARELRAQGRRLPLVVMGPADQVADWCDQVGGTTALAKPFDLRDLLAALDRVVRSGPAIES